MPSSSNTSGRGWSPRQNPGADITVRRRDSKYGGRGMRASSSSLSPGWRNCARAARNAGVQSASVSPRSTSATSPSLTTGTSPHNIHFPAKLPGEVVAQANPLLGCAIPKKLLTLKHEALLQRRAVGRFAADELQRRAATHRDAGFDKRIAVIVRNICDQYRSAPDQIDYRRLHVVASHALAPDASHVAGPFDHCSDVVGLGRIAPKR